MGGHSIAMYPGVQRAILRVAVFLVISGSCVIVDNDHSVTPIPQEEFVTTTIDFQGSDEIVPEGTEGDLLMAAPSGTRRVPKARNTISSAVAQYKKNQALNSAANQAAPSGTRRVPKGKSSGTQACPCRAKGKSSGTQAVSTGKSKGKSSGTEAVSTGPSKGKSRRLLMAAPSGTRRVPKARNTVSSAVAQYNTNQALNSAAN